MNEALTNKAGQEIRFVASVPEDAYCNNTLKRRFENLQARHERALMDIEGLKRENFQLKDRCRKLESALVEAAIKQEERNA